MRSRGLPQRIVPIPYPCPNEIYEARMGEAVAQARSRRHHAYDLRRFVPRDIRAYREAKLAGTGITPIFPLWDRPTPELARAMMESGLEAYLATVDLKKLAAEFAGRKFDVQLLADLPDGVDPAARTASSTPAWWRDRCFHVVFQSVRPNASSAMATPIAIWCSRRPQHAIKRRQPDEHGRRDQGVAYGAKNRFARPCRTAKRRTRCRSHRLARQPKRT